MSERFTDQAHRAVTLAQDEARMLNHNYIGTEHILLGLIREREGVAATALESLGISLEAARQQVEELIGRGKQAPSGRIPFTPRAKTAIELSLREALRLGDNQIGTGHIMLALTEDAAGGTAEILAGFGTNSVSARRQVMLRLQADRKQRSAQAWASAATDTSTPNRVGDA